MFEGATYATSQITIAPGDLLVFFSDGITEAENAAGQAFDEAGLQSVVALRAEEDPETLGRAILQVVEAHAGHLRLADDLTALVLKRTPAAAA
jgi:phosphoserine phosphatase RsbU/P